MVCAVRLSEETYHHYNRVVMEMCVFDVGVLGADEESACFLWVQCFGVIKVAGVLQGGEAGWGVIRVGRSFLLLPSNRHCLGSHGSLGCLSLLPLPSQLETSFGVTWSFCIDLP